MYGSETMMGGGNWSYSAIAFSGAVALYFFKAFLFLLFLLI